MALRREAVELDRERRRLWDDHGTMYEYGRVADRDRRISAPLQRARLRPRLRSRYYRYLEDYLALQERLDASAATRW